MGKAAAAAAAEGSRAESVDEKRWRDASEGRKEGRKQTAVVEEREKRGE